MASVTWTQWNNAVKSGVETIAIDDVSAADALTFLLTKEASHRAHGWTTTWITANVSFSASKVGQGAGQGHDRDRTWLLKLV